MKIAIIGAKDAILGFKAVGVEPHPIASREDGRDIISKLAKSDDYGIVMITEDWAGPLKEELGDLEEKTIPAVIIIPSAQGATGEGARALKRIIEQAIGSDILNIKIN